MTSRRLGRYRIDRPLGRGATATVFAGQHAPSGWPVAVKVWATAPSKASILREIQALARLDHPAIVRVLDHGEVGPEEAGEGDGWRAGQPYVVMELVEGGTLSARCGRLAWPDAQWALRNLLEALAHAHAHGLLHLDIKPSNVLVEAGLRSVRLSDFGLARPVAEAAMTVAGTPPFMAPEQFGGDRWELGPWTDLYGLGCLAWQLLTGAPPFRAATLVKAMNAHRHRPLPRLEPRVPVPEGLARWLSRLLEKDPCARFRHAVDAHAELMALDATPHAYASPAPDLAPPDAGRLQSGMDSDTLPPLRARLPVLRGGAYRTPPRRPARTPPPSWREPTRDVVSIPRVPYGIGLSAVREPPLVGRERERDALWSALCALWREGGRGVFTLEGAEGLGKTRLARWLGERAAASGVASWIRVAGRPLQRAVDAVGAMARALIGVGARAGGEAAQAVRGWAEARGETDPAIVEALQLLLEQDPWGDEGVAAAPREQVDVAGLAHLLRLHGEGAGIVWVVDGMDHDPGVLTLARDLLASEVLDAPLLVVITSRPGAFERASLGRTFPPPLWRAHLELRPLAAEDQLTLLREGLSVAEPLATVLARRTAGNPLFAIQVVQAGVQAGLLVEEGQGLRPADGGSSPPIASSLTEVWRARALLAMDGLSAAERAAIDVAVVMGAHFSLSRWRRAAGLLGRRADEGDLSRLTAAGLLSLRDDQAAFEHPAVREALLERLGGDAAAIHRACAGALADADNPEDCQLLAEHLAAAGAWREALHPLFLAAYHAHSDRTEGLVRLFDEAAGRAALPASDHLRGEVMLVRWWSLRQQGRGPEAASLIDRIEAAALEHGWVRVRLKVLHARGALWRAGGRHEELIAGMLEGCRAALDAGEPGLAAMLTGDLGALLAQLGRFDEALALMDRTLPWLREGGLVYNQAFSRATAGMCGLWAGRLALAEAHLEAGLRDLDAIPHSRKFIRPFLLACRGRVALLRGELDRAEACANENILTRKGRGSLGRAAQDELVLAQVRAARGDLRAARAMLEGCCEHFRRAGLDMWEFFAITALLPVLSTIRDWEGMGAALARTSQLSVAPGVEAFGVAVHLARAGRDAARHGQSALAGRCARIAEARRDVLGEEARRAVAELDRASGALSSA